MPFIRPKYPVNNYNEKSNLNLQSSNPFKLTQPSLKLLPSLVHYPNFKPTSAVTESTKSQIINNKLRKIIKINYSNKISNVSDNSKSSDFIPTTTPLTAKEYFNRNLIAEVDLKFYFLNVKNAENNIDYINILAFSSDILFLCETWHHTDKQLEGLI